MRGVLNYRMFILSLALSFGIINPAVTHAQSQIQDTTRQLDLGSTGQQEDMSRFMGIEPVLERYYSIPYDVFTSVNLNIPFLDLGFILVIFLPMILLLGRKSGVVTGLSFVLILSLGLVASVSSSFLQRFKLDHATAIRSLEHARENENMSMLQYSDNLLITPMLKVMEKLHPAISQHTGERDAITYPLLFALFFLILILVLQRFKGEETGIMSVLLIWYYYSFLWLIMAAAIPWYGILMFPLGMILVIYGVTHIPTGKILPGWPKYLLYGASLLWIFLFFTLRFSGLNPKPDVRGKLPHYPEIVNYQIGKFTPEEAIETLYPQIYKSMGFLNANTNSLIYDIGTYMPFYIERSDRRVYQDPFLDFFARLTDAIPDKNLLAESLYKYGFEYIILDLNLMSVDKTKDQSLTKKFEKFLAFVYQNRHLELVSTDNLVRLERDGSEVFGVGLYEPHTLVRRGKYAVYRLY